jgi:acetyltransferase-like isoleucine patch superfamily enzyme
VSVPDELTQRADGTVILRGDDNTVVIGEAGRGQSIHIEVGTKCRVDVGQNVALGSFFAYALRDATICVGPNCGFNGAVRLLCHEPATLTIGAGCLFAGGIDVTTSDMHSVVDVATGERVNPARDVVIEERVWIGQRAMILKGAHIGAGSVIGACAVVSGRIPPNSAAAGVPARVIRRDVTWRFDLI